MELGFIVYILLVFVCGGFALFALMFYLIRAFIVRRHQVAWSARTLRSKVALLIVIGLTAALLFVPLRMIWVTRLGAMPGEYKSDGVWGSAALEVSADGSFIETWHFRNEYTGQSEGDGSMHGRWRDGGREWLTRNVFLEPFTPLAQYDRGKIYRSNPVNVQGYGGFTALEVDLGADITFWK